MIDEISGPELILGPNVILVPGVMFTPPTVAESDATAA